MSNFDKKHAETAEEFQLGSVCIQNLFLNPSSSASLLHRARIALDVVLIAFNPVTRILVSDYVCTCDN